MVRSISAGAIVIGLVSCAVTVPDERSYPLDTSGTTTTTTTADQCGLSNPELDACTTCFETQCCSQGSACAQDPTCNDCANSASPAPSCGSNAAYAALSQCLTQQCSQACACVPKGGDCSVAACCQPPDSTFPLACVNDNVSYTCFECCSSSSQCNGGCCSQLAQPESADCPGVCANGGNCLP
jgi:hypothetical protein